MTRSERQRSRSATKVELRVDSAYDSIGSDSEMSYKKDISDSE